MTSASAAPACVIAVMAKEPAPGRTKTRLCPPLTPLAAAQLYEALMSDTIALLSTLRDIRVAVAVTPADAIGSWTPRVPAGAMVLTVAGRDIGDCLQQTTERLFAAGFARVVAMNSDGPTLPATCLRQADALLASVDVVLGPSEDGGYYLVGLRQPRPGLFRDIAWSSPRVLAQTLERAAALGLSVALLPTWYDVDTARDLERLRVELRGLPQRVAPRTRRFLIDCRTPIDGHETGASWCTARSSRRKEIGG